MLPLCRIVLLLSYLILSAACTGSPAPGPEPPSPPTSGSPVQWDLDWARGAVFYEVFVRSFADSDGDGVGDLPGLISKLDYLNDGDPATASDLEVDGLWLMPVFESPSYHGYDVVDYEAIDREYGTGADFERLLAEAHRRGMRVIVDLVTNHTGAEHPWFQESKSSPSSPRRDWYVWRSDDPGWTQPWGGSSSPWHRSEHGFYYGVFWSGMPDLNHRNPAVRQELQRIATSWIGRGVDGFRLDATRHLVEEGPGQQQVNSPATHASLKEFSAAVRRASPRALLVGENWTDTPSIAAYFGSTAEIAAGDELPMSFNFPLAGAIVEGAETGEASGIAAKLTEMAEVYPEGVLDAPFLTNHDMIRLATQLGEDEAKQKSAAAVLLTLPGTPFLYYGEEVGLENGPGGQDELKRTPMPWDGSPGGGFTTGKPWFDFAPGREEANVAAHTGEPGSLLTHYRNLIRARRDSRALRQGTLRLLTPGDRSSPILAFVREAGGERVLVAHNLGSVAAEAGPWNVPGSPDPLFASPGVAPPGSSPGARTVRLPPGASGVWRLR